MNTFNEKNDIRDLLFELVETATEMANVGNFDPHTLNQLRTLNLLIADPIKRNNIYEKWQARLSFRLKLNKFAA